LEVVGQVIETNVEKVEAIGKAITDNIKAILTDK
jgi:hypothetical protein